ncbi:MAG TPA: biopolymer transporter ExbD [Leptolyngbyaceae cyanobacterium M33_DOE_097]|uniref:Biopolymer transporter ExbD n=1 Tax=Oscillatoriales cyanobacterium SpSt-418 TaxID=2282169 RepID=A0A7C3KED0_9CYAN|nr:biopolymer transporter ExbD [Leptolyngbyaceae cyanobacterium M33_DOE_097]
MKIHLDSPAEEAQIQVVPLIDVIFCILIFFILAALQFTRQQGIELELPKAQTSTTPAREMLVVTITPSGSKLVNENPQPFDNLQLRQILQEYRRQQPQGLLVLNASRNALYDEVVQVLDLMREVGGDRVALATLPAENNQPGLDSNQQDPNLVPVPGQTLPTLPPGDGYSIPLTPGSGRSLDTLPSLAPELKPERRSRSESSSEEPAGSESAR